MHMQLGTKSAFGFHALIVMNNGYTRIVRVSLKDWLYMKDVLKLSVEG